KYTSGTTPTGDPNARYSAPHNAATGRINTEIRTSSAFRAARSASSRGSAPTSASRAVTRSAPAWIGPRRCIAARRYSRTPPHPLATRGPGTTRRRKPARIPTTHQLFAEFGTEAFGDRARVELEATGEPSRNQSRRTRVRLPLGRVRREVALPLNRCGELAV